MSLLDAKQWTGKIFVNDWVAGSGGEYTVREPATGGDLGALGTATPDDVRRAAARAAEAQVEWASTPYDQRAAILMKAARLFTEHAGEISDWIVREAGSTPPKAGFETHMAEGLSNAAAALTLHPYGELIRSSSPDRMSLTRRLPVGVVGVIAPFNVPLVLAIRYVAPALALGNAVLLKPDPRTSVSGGVAVARVFEEAGLPPGVLAVLPGGVDVGQAIISDPAVGALVFTGSTRAGRAVAKLAAEHLKRVHLELGGNSAFVVLDDADLERAIPAGSFGSFFHQGQVCMSASRHLVHSGIAADYTAKMVEHADRLTVGNPATEQVALGPVIDDGQRDRIHGLVTASVDGGARLAAGGTYDRLFYRPTVLAEVPTTAPAYMEEIFGPVAPITTFDTLEEAAQLAADTSYGLSLSIVTRDVMKGMALAERIPSGVVHINDQTIADEPTVPFGGVKDSGAGSHLGGFGANLEAFTELQWVTMQTEIPPYPF